MIVWRSFGASVIGPGHIGVKKPNQDAWTSFHHVWGDGIIVSDGLGSKPFSDIGSRAACLAVSSAVHAWIVSPNMDYTALSEQIKSRWISFLTPLRPCDCAATCLFAFRGQRTSVLIGMLGDGLAATVRTDGSVALLSDEKEEGFSNITAALSTEVAAKDWQWLSLPEEECLSIILCTDGVADDLIDAKGFVEEFCDVHQGLASVSAVRRIREMLENWPVPMHSDDKTIACLYRVEVMDE